MAKLDVKTTHYKRPVLGGLSLRLNHSLRSDQCLVPRVCLQVKPLRIQRFISGHQLECRIMLSTTVFLAFGTAKSFVIFPVCNLALPTKMRRLHLRPKEIILLKEQQIRRRSYLPHEGGSQRFFWHCGGSF